MVTGVFTSSFCSLTAPSSAPFRSYIPHAAESLWGSLVTLGKYGRAVLCGSIGRDSSEGWRIRRCGITKVGF